MASSVYCHGDQKRSAAEAGGCEPAGAARGTGAPGSARLPEAASRADRSGFRVGSAVCRERPRPDARVPASRDRTAHRLRPLSPANGRRGLPRGSVRGPRRDVHQADGVDAAGPDAWAARA